MCVLCVRAGAAAGWLAQGGSLMPRAPALTPHPFPAQRGGGGAQDQEQEVGQGQQGVAQGGGQAEDGAPRGSAQQPPGAGGRNLRRGSCGWYLLMSHLVRHQCTRTCM